MSSPSNTHWLAVKRILRYLKGTAFYGLSMQLSSTLDIQTYTNADWASCPNDRRNTNGYCIFIGPNLVSWSSTKQKIVSTSNMESEYHGLAVAASEIAWIQSLLTELCLSLTTPPLLWHDNQSATHLDVNPVFHARTKHIELNFHFTCDKVLQNQLHIHYFPSFDQIANIFTKHISSSQFFSFWKLSIAPKPTSLRGDDRSQLHQQQKAVATTKPRSLKNCANS